MLWKIGSHLQRTVHYEIERKLTTEGGMNITLIVAPLRKLGLEDTRSVIHRTTLQTGEWQHYGMIRLVTAKCLILCTTCTLVANQVRPGTADTCRTGCLVSIHHDMMLGSGLDDTLVVIVHQLAVMILASRDDITHITGLHGIITIFVHQIEGIFQVALVVESCRRCLVVHHQLHALRVSIVVEHLDIEVWIWSHEVEDIELLMTEPVFPTFVPAFYQYFLQTVLGSKVDIALYFLVGCTMSTVRLALAVIGYTETHRWQIVGIAPGLGTYNHVPPYTAILGRMNPGCILNLARLVKVQCQLA